MEASDWPAPLTTPMYLGGAAAFTVSIALVNTLLAMVFLTQMTPVRRARRVPWETGMKEGTAMPTVNGMLPTIPRRQALIVPISLCAHINKFQYAL